MDLSLPLYLSLHLDHKRLFLHLTSFTFPSLPQSASQSLVASSIDALRRLITTSTIVPKNFLSSSGLFFFLPRTTPFPYFPKVPLLVGSDPLRILPSDQSPQQKSLRHRLSRRWPILPTTNIKHCQRTTTRLFTRSLWLPPLWITRPPTATATMVRFFSTQTAPPSTTRR